MFYDPRSEPHGLPHNPWNALISPRPIGWISTVSADGIANLAPYSFFNAVSGSPPFVMFSSTPRKHSLTNIEATGEFVVNLATYAQREAVNATSASLPPGEDEFVAQQANARLVGRVPGARALPGPCKRVEIP